MGVGNIMFIIVKECIKEIGVCKALGVLLLSIVWMVLVELVFIMAILGYLGFIVGIFLIWGISLLMCVNDVILDNFYNLEISLFVGIGLVILLMFFGVIVGVIFVWYVVWVNLVVVFKDE